MSFVTLKEKGQLTLPATIRKKLNASTGDMFDVQMVEGHIVLTLQKIEPITALPKSKAIEEALRLTNSLKPLPANESESTQDALDTLRFSRS